MNWPIARGICVVGLFFFAGVNAEKGQYGWMAAEVLIELLNFAILITELSEAQDA